MKTPTPILLALFLGFLSALVPSPSSRAGNIVGSVRAQGLQDIAGGTEGGKYDSRKFRFAERVDYAAIREFIVYVDETPKVRPTPPTGPLRIVTQRDMTFRPHLLPVLLGTTVEWPNEDDIYHNVFSISDPLCFNLGLYKKDPKSVIFDKPGRVDVFCSIHKDMHCIVMVLQNPHFAATDKNGRFVIRDLPAGNYPLKAWHERVPSQTRTIVVPETGDVQVDFVLRIAPPPVTPPPPSKP